ncbi:MAG: FN3 associated domain-containing protein [bacterium]
MGPESNKSWGTGKENLPFSSITTDLITPVPSVDAVSPTFTDSIVIRLVCSEPEAKIFFTLDETEPTLNSSLYHRPIVINKTTKVMAFAVAEGQPESFRIEATFSQIPKDRRITLKTLYAPQYSGGGEDALINFIRGGENFSTGNWQGYEGGDIDALIDLGQIQEIRKIFMGSLQDQGSWIFFPVQVEFYLSADGKEFKKAGVVANDVPDSADGTMTKEFTLNTGNSKARFIRVVAKNRGTCPVWHPGAGQKAWVFADEIVVE